MPFYIRYFDNETILPKEEDILPYLSQLKTMSSSDLNVMARNIGKLKKGTNRIYLDKQKRKYILIISTDKQDISDFRRHKKENPSGPGSRPTGPNPAMRKNRDRTNGNNMRDLMVQKGWRIYSIDYINKEGEKDECYTFKAKIKNVSPFIAYRQMMAFLMMKHHNQCCFRPYRPDRITIKPDK